MYDLYLHDAAHTEAIVDFGRSNGTDGAVKSLGQDCQQQSGVLLLAAHCAVLASAVRRPRTFVRLDLHMMQTHPPLP